MQNEPSRPQVTITSLHQYKQTIFCFIYWICLLNYAMFVLFHIMIIVHYCNWSTESVWYIHVDYMYVSTGLRHKSQTL